MPMVGSWENLGRIWKYETFPWPVGYFSFWRPINNADYNNSLFDVWESEASTFEFMFKVDFILRAY